MSEIKLVTKTDIRDEKAIVEVPEPIGHLTLNSKQVPEILNWTPGHDYILTIKVRQDSTRIPSRYEVENESNDLEATDIVADFSVIRAKAKSESVDED